MRTAMRSQGHAHTRECICGPSIRNLFVGDRNQDCKRTDMPRALRRKGLSIFCHSMPRAGKAV